MQQATSLNNLSVNEDLLGWNKKDIDALMIGAKEAKQKGLPLKTVFEDLAKVTGRKPNSVRNYYYAMLKQSTKFAEVLGKPQSFEPFDQQEVYDLVKEVLKAQAKGESIRSCTLRLGKGSMKEMLRFQNKYRSAVKSNPQVIKEAIRQLQEQGEPFVNPYEHVSKRGRPSKKQSGAMELKTGAGGDAIINTLGGILKDLEKSEDINILKFFEDLSHLTSAAARRKGQDSYKYKDKCELLERALVSKQRECNELKSENENLTQSLKATQEELADTRDQLEQQKKIAMQLRGNMNASLSMLRQIIGVNKEFLRMNSIIKMSNLTQYISELQKNIDVCEKIVSNTVNL